jgi:endo-1,4-beta-mannosidase
MHKTISKYLCGFIMIFTALNAACSAQRHDTQCPKGLYVRNGVILHEGQPYRAMGINYHNALGLLLDDAQNRDFVEGFKILKDHKIPYIRLRFGPFEHMGWKFYQDNPKEYFRRMDLFVREAEKQKIGLIPSMFWYICSVPDFVNEPLSALGETSSRSRAFIRKYTADVVSRYKDSSAIYGWEFGNEYMLFADLPKYDHLPPKKTGTDQPRTKADKLLRPMILDMYKDFYQTIRQIDTNRIIVTGDSIPRAQAWHNRNEDSWGHDSREQWLEMFEADTPECYEVVSFHLYKETDGKYYHEKVPMEKVVSDITQTCRKNNKIIWAGELGMPGNDQEAKELFFRMMKTIEDNEIELSAIWNFIPNGRFQPDWDILPQGGRAYMLKAVKELNERFAYGADIDAGGDKPGLTVMNGEFYKGGKPYKGIGINYFSALIRMTGQEGYPPNLSDRSYRQGLETLKQHDIPFVRFCASGFYPNDWKVYLNNKEDFFTAFDSLVADAERLQIGLIPSLFWYFPTVPDIVGESVNQWGNPRSKTCEFMRQFTTEVVERYKDSPAIWAWEFGNEYILESDIPGLEHGRGWTEPDHAPKPPVGLALKRTVDDKMYRKNIWPAYREFVKAVRRIDRHRPVFSGDTMPRPSAYNNMKNDNWENDTKDQWKSVFVNDNAMMSGLSAHFYYYFKDDKHIHGGVHGFVPDEQMAFMMEIAEETCKPLFIGEFGPANRDNTREQEREQFEAVLGLILENQVPLSALWNFDFEHEDQVRWNITDDNHRAYMLDAIQQANKRLNKK